MSEIISLKMGEKCCTSLEMGEKLSQGLSLIACKNAIAGYISCKIMLSRDIE